MKKLMLQIIKASFNLEISNEVTLNEDNLTITLPGGKQVKICIE